MGLPAEIYLHVLSYLVPSDLAALARCSRSQCRVVTPVLYRNLSLQLRSGDPDRSSTVLLRTLAAKSPLRYFIRHVEIFSPPSGIWTFGHSKLLGILLSTILTHPERITTFRWKAGLLQTHIFFPELTTLECTKIANVTDLLWVRWHFLYCRSLKAIRLYLSERVYKDAGPWFLSHLSLPHLQHLSLRGADLSNLAIEVVGSLRSLELNLCLGLGGFLARIVSHGPPSSLKSLKIAGNISLTTLGHFVAAVTSKSQLEELSLRIGSVNAYLSTTFIQSLVPGLISLVLDFRQDLYDPRSQVKYNIRDFQNIIRGFPLLRFLGLAVDLRNPKFRRYQRAKFVVSANYKHIPDAKLSPLIYYTERSGIDRV